MPDEKDPIDELCDAMSSMPQDKKDKMIDDATKRVDEYKHRHDDAHAFGKELSDNINEKFKCIPVVHRGKTYKDKGLETDLCSAALSEILLRCYLKGDEAENCGDLLMEWTMDKFWGKVVNSYVPKLTEVWQWLYDNKRDKNNTFDYGDADGSIWYEEIKQTEKWPDRRKVIIHKSHCSCANDRTHIFILDDNDSAIGDKLRVRTVWDRQNSRGGYAVQKCKEWPDGWLSWGDDRDIKVPSLRTYRDRNFKFSYGDGRDKGYVLSLNGFGGPKIEWAMNNQDKIKHAIWLISYMFDMSESPDEYECK